MRTSAPRILLIAVLLLAGTAGSASAATLRFTAAASSDWNTAANWEDVANTSLHAVPGAGDDALVPSGRTPSLSSGAAGAARSLTVEAGSSLTVSGRDLAVGGGSPSAFAGNMVVRTRRCGSAARRLGTPAPGSSTTRRWSTTGS